MSDSDGSRVLVAIPNAVKWQAPSPVSSSAQALCPHG